LARKFDDTSNFLEQDFARSGLFLKNAIPKSLSSVCKRDVFWLGEEIRRNVDFKLTAPAWPR